MNGPHSTPALLAALRKLAMERGTDEQSQISIECFADYNLEQIDAWFTSYEALNVHAEFIVQAQKAGLEELASTDIRFRNAATLMAVHQRERKLEVQVKNLSTLYAAEGIDYILVKGAAFNLGGYNEFDGQRFIGDIDIVVSPDQLDKAYALLLSSGYDSELKLAQPISEYWVGKHLPPVDSESYFYSIECHLKPFAKEVRGKPFISTEELFQYSSPASLAQPNALTPNIEHMLLYTFFASQIEDANYVVSAPNQRSLLDTAVLLSKGNIDWDIIQRKLTDAKLTDEYANYIGQCSELVHAGIEKQLPTELRGKRRRGFNYLSPASVINSKWKLRTVSVIIFYREIAKLNSDKQRKQRAEILKANPEMWMYRPLYQQFLVPKYLKSRIMYFLTRRLRGM